MYPGARPCAVMSCSVIKIISKSIVKQRRQSNEAHQSYVSGPGFITL